MIKVILWDIDGTLLNFKEAEKAAIRRCFEEMNLGECTDSMLADYSRINDIYWQRLERKEMTKPEILVGRFTEFFTKYSIDPDKAKRFNDMYQTRLGDVIVFTPNAYETVESLCGKVLQCVVTNGTKIRQDKKLLNSGLGGLMDHVFISEELGTEKPGIEFFNKVYETIGYYNSDEVLIVGDSLTSDMQGGVNAGIKTCWYNPDKKKNSSVNTFDYEITDIAQVLEILDKEGKENTMNEPLFTSTTEYTFDKYRNFAKLIAKIENKFWQKIAVMELCLLILAFLCYMTGTILYVSCLICMVVVPFLLVSRQNRSLVTVWNSTPAAHNLVYRYEFYEDHFHSENTVSSLDLKYDNIYRIIEGEYQFYIMTGKNQGLIIDKINCSEQLKAFLTDLMKKTDEKRGKK